VVNLPNHGKPCLRLPLTTLLSGALTAMLEGKARLLPNLYGRVKFGTSNELPRSCPSSHLDMTKVLRDLRKWYISPTEGVENTEYIAILWSVGP
jgi:hypothetical protein